MTIETMQAKLTQLEQELTATVQARDRAQAALNEATVRAIRLEGAIACLRQLLNPAKESTRG